MSRLMAQQVYSTCSILKDENERQAEAFLRVEEMLSEEEAAVARRARNTNQSPPKNADPAEYHRATALEALIGYLYVTGRRERMRQILETALPPEQIEER